LSKNTQTNKYFFLFEKKKRNKVEPYDK